MLLKIGYDLTYQHNEFTPVVLMLEVHPSRLDDLLSLDVPRTTPNLPLDRYYDSFGNRCCRIVAPPGDVRIFSEVTIRDSGHPDTTAPFAPQHPEEVCHTTRSGTCWEADTVKRNCYPMRRGVCSDTPHWKRRGCKRSAILCTDI